MQRPKFPNCLECGTKASMYVERTNSFIFPCKCEMPNGPKVPESIEIIEFSVDDGCDEPILITSQPGAEQWPYKEKLNYFREEFKSYSLFQKILLLIFVSPFFPLILLYWLIRPLLYNSDSDRK